MRFRVPWASLLAEDGGKWQPAAAAGMICPRAQSSSVFSDRSGNSYLRLVKN